MSASTWLAFAIYCHYTSAGYRWVLALWFVEIDVWFSHTLDSKNLWGFSDDLSFCSSPSFGLPAFLRTVWPVCPWTLWRWMAKLSLVVCSTMVEAWWSERDCSFPLWGLGLCGGHKMLVCHKGSRVVEQHCQYSDLIKKREKNRGSR